MIPKPVWSPCSLQTRRSNPFVYHHVALPMVSPFHIQLAMFQIEVETILP